MKKRVRIRAEKPKKIVFWGAKGHAKVLRESAGHFGYELIALFDNDRAVRPPFDDVPLFYGKEGFNRWLSDTDLRKASVSFLVAIGGARGEDRHLIQKFMEESGLSSITLIHPAAFCAGNAALGRGTQVMANSTVGVDVKIGEACIVNTGATVDHESVLSDGVHVCPGSHIAGEVRIGPYSMIGIGAVVLPGVNIGSNVIVGAGSVVIRDVANDVVVCGNPARTLKNNTTA